MKRANGRIYIMWYYLHKVNMQNNSVYYRWMHTYNKKHKNSHK